MKKRNEPIALAALALGLLAALPLVAQGPIADFKPADYVVTLDGVTVDADVWQSAIAGEMLIVSNEIGPARSA